MAETPEFVKFSDVFDDLPRQEVQLNFKKALKKYQNSDDDDTPDHGLICGACLDMCPPNERVVAFNNCCECGERKPLYHKDEFTDDQ